MKFKIVSGVDLYVGCVDMPTQGHIKHLCTDIFDLLEEDICTFQSKVDDFNVRVGNSCNSKGKLLIELLLNCNLIWSAMVELCFSDSQWTWVQSHLGRKSNY